MLELESSTRQLAILEQYLCAQLELSSLLMLGVQGLRNDNGELDEGKPPSSERLQPGTVSTRDSLAVAAQHVLMQERSSAIDHRLTRTRFR